MAVRLHMAVRSLGRFVAYPSLVHCKTKTANSKNTVYALMIIHHNIRLSRILDGF